MLINQLESASGVVRDTIRYYEKIGLIGAPVRRANGYRDYAQAAVNELRFIRRAQRAGFTLAEIRPAIPQLQHPKAHCEEFVAALCAKRDEIKAHLATERARLKDLESLITRFSAAARAPAVRAKSATPSTDQRRSRAGP